MPPPRKKKTLQKIIIGGLALAFLGIIVGSMVETEFLFIAGMFFIGMIILGVVGILKMRKEQQ